MNSCVQQALIIILLVPKRKLIVYHVLEGEFPPWGLPVLLLVGYKWFCILIGIFCIFARSYCETDGLANPTGLCDAGWYCNGSAVSAQESVYGGECQAGTYCPEGSHRPTDCDPGKYCETNGLSVPTGNCSSGKSLLNVHIVKCFKRFFSEF